MQDIYIVSAVRTAIGTFGGTLKDEPPARIGAVVAKAAIERAGIAPAQIGHTVVGQVMPTEPADAYVARVVSMDAGVPHETPALTVNRLCGSGMQAIVTAAQMAMLGDCDIALAGGTEVMSRVPFQAPGMRWGQRMGDGVFVDSLIGMLNDPFGKFHMGITAENVAERFAISREAQDALAAESHRRAAAAAAAGHFADQIVPIDVKVHRQIMAFATDEHVKAETSADTLSALRPAFRRDGGSVTAGNASGINDGAAALVLATEQAVKRDGLTPLARLVSYGHAGVDPAFMGIGPVPAVRQALARAGLSLGVIDVIEANEAFAAQACAVAQELGFDPAKVNPNGSGISLGHPVGATGAIITVKLLHELQRTGGRYGLATMCIGGGQGIAAIFERV